MINYIELCQAINASDFKNKFSEELAARFSAKPDYVPNAREKRILERLYNFVESLKKEDKPVESEKPVS